MKRIAGLAARKKRGPLFLKFSPANGAAVIAVREGKAIPCRRLS
jgi:hypothetical protein